MHPHRGIETVTYMLAGTVHHKDSLGNSGAIGAGDVQWMTAGGGIMHEEMPQPVEGKMGGFQLWVNLPARLKMTRPRYQEVKADQIPLVERPDGVRIRVIAGLVDGVPGPVTEIYTDPAYLDVTVPGGQLFSHAIPQDHTVFAYLFEGSAAFAGGAELVAPRLVSFTGGEEVQAQAGPSGARFLLVSGKPLGEPISRYGPFVMNTREEILQALDDLRNGIFVKK
jgi:quercetin 2,3-dioxygenase